MNENSRFIAVDRSNNPDFPAGEQETLSPRVLGLGQGEVTIPENFDQIAAVEIAELFSGAPAC
jgi:hypothetical protein